MNQQEIISAIALTRISYFSLAELLELFRRVGSAEEIVAHSQHIRDLLPDASDRPTQAFTDIGEALRYAENELRTAEGMGVRPLVMGDDDYPSRLLECADAPLVLYYQGSASLNQKRVVSIVGTRRCTPYGQDLVRRFMSELRRLCRDLCEILRD